jgi:hypothetical protein
MNAPNSAGLMRTTSAPSSRKRFCVSAEPRMAESSRCSRSTTAGGVPAGAAMPYQLLAS